MRAAPAENIAFRERRIFGSTMCLNAKGRRPKPTPCLLSVSNSYGQYQTGPRGGGLVYRGQLMRGACFLTEAANGVSRQLVDGSVPGWVRASYLRP